MKFFKRKAPTGPVSPDQFEENRDQRLKKIRARSVNQLFAGITSAINDYGTRTITDEDVWVDWIDSKILAALDDKLKPYGWQVIHQEHHMRDNTLLGFSITVGPI